MIRWFTLWNAWRKHTRSGLPYQLLVLFKVVRSPSLETFIPIYVHKRKKSDWDA